jgi:hypothetical protein
VKHVVRRTLALLSVGVLTLSACSDSSTGPKTTATMTPQEALSVASGIMLEISNALAATTGGLNVADVRTSAAVMPTETFSSPCTSGGRITGSITFTDNVNSAGTGTLTGAMTATPQGCMVSNGTKMIAVSGQWTVDFSMSFNQFAQAGDFIWHAKGNFTWDGGNCSLDYTMTISADGHGSLTGTFCVVTLNSTI